MFYFTRDRSLTVGLSTIRSRRLTVAVAYEQLAYTAPRLNSNSISRLLRHQRLNLNSADVKEIVLVQFQFNDGLSL